MVVRTDMTGRRASRRKVAIITTGGTIACRIDESGKLLPVVSGTELISLVPGLEQIADLELISFAQISSWNITPAWMLELAQQIDQASAQGLDGIVVTHGTDTLEETAYFLDLTVQSRCPVVITGAMRNNSEPSPDGPRNLLNAIRVASSPAAPADGVLVVFNDEIHRPKEVTKTHTFSVSTFQSPFAGPIGYADGAEVVFVRQPLSHRRVRPVTAGLDVFLIKASAGASNSLIRCCIDLGADGIVLEGTGLGHVPADWVLTIRDAIGKEIPVVLTSRTLGGRVRPLYGDVGGGQELSEAGVINGGSLSGPKARIKLIVGLGAGMKAGELRDFFGEDAA